jgi:hypothetical protein
LLRAWRPIESPASSPKFTDLEPALADQFAETHLRDQAERRFYRFFSFDTGGRIVLAEDHECDSDRSALAVGQNILAGKNYPKIEVWFRKERIGVLEIVALS